jgi:predicted O-methyltransferase YrrM
VGDETRKANRRRVNDPLYRKIFTGRGIDIGCGDDPLDRDACFPAIEHLDRFDLSMGDAQDMSRHRQAESYDFVYSSHCLEHLRDPAGALRSWFTLVRPGGHLVVMVPDEDLYEQGTWPSHFNADHRWTFTIMKQTSWSPRSINIMTMIAENLSGFSFIRATLADDCYDYAITGVDQPSGPAETGIEIILRKHTSSVGHWQGRIDLDRLLTTGEVIGNSENLGHRLPTVRSCVRLLRERSPKVFVECGSQTTNLLHSQGLSTTIWAAVAALMGGRLWTVDHDPNAMQRCRSLTSAYDNIDYVVSDSVPFLREFDRTIDFLYLDTYDFYDHCREESRRHQLAEVEAAFPRLAREAVVLLDDAHVQMWFTRPLDESDIQGTTLLSHAFLLRHGARCVSAQTDYQRVYVLHQN